MDSRAAKAKKAVGTTAHAPATHAGPTTFFLKTEKELEMGVQRGRKVLRSALDAERSATEASITSSIAHSTFGVESLEETIGSAFPAEHTLSRTSTSSTDSSVGEEMASTSRQRKVGNPVHPKIKSTGQRILSSEPKLKAAPAAPSPTSARSAESPFRMRSSRRPSASPSSERRSMPFTPVKMSPRPRSVASGTPRSASLKSFRLSDEEGSGSDECKIPAAAPAAAEPEHVVSTTQLVMPSIAMPTRRAFTEHGKSMGRLKVMVIGPPRVGKSSLIHSIIRSSDDIVHVDAVPVSTSSDSRDARSSPGFVEVSASTKPCPSWWAELDLPADPRRRVSMGDVLERNLVFIDTPPLGDEAQIQRLSDYVSSTMCRTSDMDSLSDTEVVGMLSGDGGAQIDAVLYICRPQLADGVGPAADGISAAHQELVQRLSKWTNLIPLIGNADQLDTETLAARKLQIKTLLASMRVESYRLDNEVDLPFAVSSAAGDDTDVIDASLLMSSQYLPPLAPSELDLVVSHLFSRANMARLRRLSATKFLAWRREHSTRALLQRDLSFDVSLHRGYHSPGLISASGMMDDPSKVLVPYGTSSYYRSLSPSISEASALPGSAYALAPLHEERNAAAPIREVITAKWAENMTWSRGHTSQRHAERFAQSTFEWNSSADPEKNDGRALVHARETQRPPRGRLGGDLGIIDPCDPLGILAFSHALRSRGLFAVQIAGGCGLLGAVCYCVMRYWMDIPELWGIGSSGSVITAHAIPPPPRPMSLFGWEHPLRDYLGWAR